MRLIEPVTLSRTIFSQYLQIVLAAIRLNIFDLAGSIRLLLVDVRVEVGEIANYEIDKPRCFIKSINMVKHPAVVPAEILPLGFVFKRPRKK